MEEMMAKRKETNLGMPLATASVHRKALVWDIASASKLESSLVHRKACALANGSDFG